jgi:hypothetical protein
MIGNKDYYYRRGKVLQLYHKKNSFDPIVVVKDRGAKNGIRRQILKITQEYPKYNVESLGISMPIL